MKTLGTMLSFDAVAFEYKQVPGRADLSMVSDPTFEATMASDARRRDVVARTDATGQLESGLEQTRQHRVRYSDFAEFTGEISKEREGEGIPGQPYRSSDCDQINRDWSITITNPPVASAEQRFSAVRENSPERRLIASPCAGLPMPPDVTYTGSRGDVIRSDIGSAVDIKRQDVLSVMPVKVSEQQTHFLPTAKPQRMISSQVSDLKAPKAVLAARCLFEEAIETQPSLDESGPKPNAVKARATATDLPQINSMLPIGPAALQVLSAVLVDGPPEPGELSRLGAGLHSPGSADTSPGSYCRMISIQLQPASLGLVQVVLRNNDRALSIRIEVESSETRGELDTDSKALTERLSAAGYLLDELRVVRMERNFDDGRSHHDLPAFDKAGDLTGSGSDNSRHRPRAAPANLRAASGVVSDELTSHAVPASNHAATVSGSRGPGQRPPRLV